MAESDPAPELIRLLCRGLSRLAVAAQGGDERLDTHLSGLRYILRGDMSDLQQLAAVINAIEERIRQVDHEQVDRADLLQRALEQLLGQLHRLDPPRATARALDRLAKRVREQPHDAAAALTELAAIQEQLLVAAQPPRDSVWNRLFGGDRSAPRQVEATSADDGDAAAQVAVPARAIEVVSTPPAPAVPAGNDGRVEVATADEPAASLDVPFSNVSVAITQVLNDLLRQLEVPPGLEETAAELNRSIGNGLNWYEQVSALEQVSVLMLTVLEHDRGQFQGFLLSLNQKLAELHQVLALSRQHHEGRSADEGVFDDALRGEVAALGAKVEQAADLDDLKTEVSGRLEAILGAMDRRQQSEQVREAAMREQLQRLAARVRDMEESAEQIGHRLAEQRRLALIDSLTQLPNRRAYEERLQQEFERWQRYGRPLAMALCDVDHFKSINDSYGHLAGDKVLRIIARTLRNRLRKADFMARYGGEEFAILLPETTVEEAAAVIEAIRAAIAESPFHFRNQPVRITISAGISAPLPNDGRDQMFERADAALYSAKQNGRNCVEVRMTDVAASA